MNKEDMYRIDGIIWWVPGNGSLRNPVPLCPNHFLRMTATSPYTSGYVAEDRKTHLECAECEETVRMPRLFGPEKQYVIDKIDSKIFKQMKVINIDDEALPLAKDEIRNPNSPYWVEARLVESKSGQRLVVYAGEKDRKNKAQIFVEPKNKRLGFDHKDHHPSDIFVKLEAVFEDGTKSTIER